MTISTTSFELSELFTVSLNLINEKRMLEKINHSNLIKLNEINSLIKNYNFMQ